MSDSTAGSLTIRFQRFAFNKPLMRLCVCVCGLVERGRIRANTGRAARREKQPWRHWAAGDRTLALITQISSDFCQQLDVNMIYCLEADGSQWQTKCFQTSIKALLDCEVVHHIRANTYSVIFLVALIQYKPVMHTSAALITSTHQSTNCRDTPLV